MISGTQPQPAPTSPISSWDKYSIWTSFAAAAALFVLGICYVPWIFSMFVVIGGIGTSGIASLLGYFIGSAAFSDKASTVLSVVVTLTATILGLFLLPATPVAVITLTVAGLMTTMVGGFGFFMLSAWVKQCIFPSSNQYEAIPQASDSGVSFVSTQQRELSNNFQTQSQTAILQVLQQQMAAGDQEHRFDGHGSQQTEPGSQQSEDNEIDEDEEEHEEDNFEKDSSPSTSVIELDTSDPTAAPTYHSHR
jgi:hypothetical protein